MDLSTLVVCVLSSTVAASIVSAVKDVFLARRKRKDDLEDRDDEGQKALTKFIERQETTDKNLDALMTEVHEYMKSNSVLMTDIIKSNKLIMLDRIKRIAYKSITAGEITYNDRKLLHDMWDEYHNAWHGNGDLNIIMETIDELPLKMDKGGF